MQFTALLLWPDIAEDLISLTTVHFGGNKYSKQSKNCTYILYPVYLHIIEILIEICNPSIILYSNYAQFLRCIVKSCPADEGEQMI